MFSGFPPNQTFNFLFIMGLAASATVASLQLHSQPIEVSKLAQSASGIFSAHKEALLMNRAASAAIAAAKRETEAEGSLAAATDEDMADVAAEDDATAEDDMADVTEEDDVTDAIPAPPSSVMELAPLHAPYLTGVPDAETVPIHVSALSATTKTAVLSEEAILVPISSSSMLRKTAAAPRASAAPSETESAATPAAPAAPTPPAETKPAALPARPGVIFEDLGRKVCIGGTACEAQCKVEPDGCEAKPVYTIKLERPLFISTVQLYAHDQVGPSRRSELFVKVNGEPVGKTEVHRYGSTRTIKIDREGQLVTIESRHKHNGFLLGGEEAVVWDVYLIGRAAL